MTTLLPGQRFSAGLFSVQDCTYTFSHLCVLNVFNVDHTQVETWLKKGGPLLPYVLYSRISFIIIINPWGHGIYLSGVVLRPVLSPCLRVKN